MRRVGVGCIGRSFPGIAIGGTGVDRTVISSSFSVRALSLSTTPSGGYGSLKVLSGSAHPSLSKDICRHLNVPLGNVSSSKFACGETNVLINESVRGNDVFIIQPTCNPTPNDALMELLIMSDAARRAGALRITAVLPLYGYARQDKKDKSRAPITGKLVADMMQVAGINHAIALDLHASQIQGFVSYPIDNLYGLPLLVNYVKTKLLPANKSPFDDMIIVSPDVGSAKRADAAATAIGCGFAIFSKKRTRPNEIASMILTGDVSGKKCIIIDDMCDTAGSLTLAATKLLEHGASEVHAAVVHGIFSGDALDKINRSPLKSMMVTNSIPMAANIDRCAKLTILDVAPLLAAAIHRVHTNQPLSPLYAADAQRLL